MCSNYENSATPFDITAAFGLDEDPPVPNQALMRPTDLGLIIGKGFKPSLQPWGLAVDWSKQPMINARSETLTEKPTFRGLLDQRCIVPASAYFEWRKTDTGKKLKNRITMPANPVFGMAGLTDGQRFTIITCAPAPEIAHIHNRMPMLLPTSAIDQWLSAEPYNDVSGLLAPFNGLFNFEEETPPPPAQADLFA